VDEFFERLRRRKIVQWALAYVAGAFALIQVLDIVAQRFDWPAMAIRFTIIVLVIGLFVVQVIAWYHGDRGAQRVTGTELLILSLLLTIGGALAWRLAPTVSEPAPEPSTAAATKSANSAAAPIDRKSIAVLPFENLSEEKANEYFASGMQDMILTKLAAIGDLKVISRTSTEKYKSHPDNLKIVAAELGVATLLEGSVQKAGNQVLINVQLIDAASDKHLWADAYPRTLENIFGVEGEVAQKIAEALRAKLTPSETANVAKVPTQNAAAYDLYLQASARANRAIDVNPLVGELMPGAIALYQQALEKDPDFALAYADLATAHMYSFFYAPDRTPARLDAAKAAVDRALALQPDLGQAHYALGQYYYWGHRDYANGTAQLEIAWRALPSSAEVAQGLAAIARRQGLWDKSLAGFLAAQTLDPRNTSVNDQLGLTYQSMRRYAEADEAFARSVAIGLDPVDERRIRAFSTVSWTGDLQPMRAFIAELAPGSDSYNAAGFVMYMERWWSRDPQGAARVAEADKSENWIDPDNLVLPRRLYLAWALHAAGDNGNAQAAYLDVQASMRALLVAQPDNAGLHLALGFAEAGLGHKQQAIAEGERATELVPITLDAITGPDYLVHLAQLYGCVGETDKAIAAINQTLAVPAGGSMSVALLKLDPVWDPIRKDPRFQKLIGDSDTAIQAQAKP
jgi:TolB-like protein